jgi:hypothetical protein
VQASRQLFFKVAADRRYPDALQDIGGEGMDEENSRRRRIDAA